MRSKLDFGNSVSASASLSYITGKMKMIGHCNGGMALCTWGGNTDSHVMTPKYTQT